MLLESVHQMMIYKLSGAQQGLCLHQGSDPLGLF
jgi:hypothetical protein